MAVQEPIDWWFCCIHPTERAVLRATIEGVVLTLNVGLPLDIWNSVWDVFPYTGQKRRDAFLWIYALEIVTIEATETVAAFDAVRALDFAAYTRFGVYLLSSSAACFGGCSQSTIPTP